MKNTLILFAAFIFCAVAQAQDVEVSVTQPKVAITLPKVKVTTPKTEESHPSCKHAECKKSKHCCHHDNGKHLGQTKNHNNASSNSKGNKHDKGNKQK